MSTPAATAIRHEFPRRFLAPLYIGTAMNPINTSLIATALVPIAHAMHVSVGRTAVLVAGLYLASSVAQPTAGKLAEELGPRRVFTAGILIVLLGGIVGGLAQSFTMLVVSRVLLGIGTSAGFPCSMLLIRRGAEHAGLTDPPGGVIGGLSIAAQVVSTIGLPLGGLLEGLFGWRSVFFVNVPVALVVLPMLLLGVPRDGPVHGARDLRSLAMRIDAVGIVGFSGTLIALMVFLLSLPTPAWPALAISAAFAAFLVWWELRAAHAFFDLRMLAGNLALSRTYVRMALITFGLYTVLYGMSQWLEDGRGLSALETGLLTMPMAIVAAISGRLVSKRNLIRGSLLISAVASIVASAGVLFLTHSTPIAFFVAITLVFGLTQGTNSFGNQGALYTQAPSEAIATASGLLRTFGYLGAIASSAATGVLFRHGADDSGLHVIAWILVGTSIVVLLMTIGDRALRGRQRIDLARETAAPPPRTMEERMSDDMPTITPQTSVLVVMDYQPGIIGRLEDGDAQVARAARALELARGAGMHVGYVRVAFTPEDAASVPPTNVMFSRAAGSMPADAPETQIDERLAPRDGDIVVRKVRVGAFSTTDLADQLRARGVDTLVLAGISTSGVVLSTVRDGFDHDYRLVVLSDGCADVDPEVHRVLTEKVFPRQAAVITIEELGQVLEG